MGSAFNVIFRIVSTLLGVFMLCIGVIWILQGLNIAFLDSFMAGDIMWTFWGILLAAFGVGQVMWSLTRKT